MSGKEKLVKEKSNHLIEETDIVFSDNYLDINKNDYSYAIKHVFCMKGSLSFVVMGKKYTIHPTEEVLLMAHQFIENVQASSDLQVKSVYFSDRLIKMMLPSPQFGMRLLLAQMQNPVLEMTRKERDLCLNVALAIKARFENTSHKFYYEVLQSAVQTFILDHYDIFARNQKEPLRGMSQTLQLFYKFICLLEKGYYRKQREVNFYAAELCISSKYLSEVSMKVTGHPASYWIDFFTTVKVSCLLMDTSKSVQEVSDALNFTSLSYFSRYVKAKFHISPKSYRKYILGER